MRMCLITETSKRELFESSLALEDNVAPPISLSAPELGNGDVFEQPTVRSAFSSTELLHERAMARFYQDMAEEETETLRRKNSLQRRRSFGSRSRVSGSLQELRPLGERTDLLGRSEKELEENKPLVRENSDIVPVKVNIGRKTFSRDSMDSMLSVEDPDRKPPLVQQPSEEDREYEDSSFDEDEYDEEEEESVGDENVEEEFDEGDEEARDERRELPYSSESEEDSRYSYSLDEDTYQPNRKMRYNEDTLISAYERRGPVILGKVTQDSIRASASKSDLPFIQENATCKEVKLKPILKRHTANNSSVVEKNTDPMIVDSIPNEDDKAKTVVTPEKRFEPNFTATLPKPILKIREQSQESISSNNQNRGGPLLAVEPELNLLSSSRTNIDEGSDYETTVKKKQVRIEEPADMMSRGVAERLEYTERAKSGSLADDVDTSRVLISHYSDIVKEFGRIKKPSKSLYLNYEALKAAADREERVSPQIQDIHGEEPKEEGHNDDKEVHLQTLVSDELEPPLNLLPNRALTVEESNEVPLSRQIYKNSDPPPMKKSLAPKRHKKRSPSPSLRPPPTLPNVKEETISEQTLFLTRTPSPELHPRPFTPTEKKVHSYFDFLTDFSLFILACWLYLFKDERLSIPILFLMIYRQAHQAFQRKMEALRNKLPRRLLFWGKQ